MSHELIYFLKVNVAIAIFYAFYRLLFHKDTFFHWRRTALLCFLIVSISYPLLNIQEWVKDHERMIAMADLYSTMMLPELTISNDAAVATPTNWKSIILSSAGYVYISVVLLLLVRFFIQLFTIIRLGLRAPTHTLQHTRVHLLPNPQGPFSFFKWVFIHPDTHNQEEIEEILTHENTHARQWHSIDVLLSELMCIVCWFNPFIWLMKREVRNNLEFMADHNVLKTGYDSKMYQYHLLGLIQPEPVAMLSNNFNILPLKIRIRMMNQKRTKKIGRVKYTLLPMVVAALLIASNILTIACSGTEKSEKPDTEVAAETPQEVQPEQVADESSLAPDEPIFEIVEQMPEFPGGQQALMKFLSSTIKYPEVSLRNEEQGRVIVQFVVTPQGDAINAKVVRSVTPELDEEALRVVSLMPKWIPGKQRGKDVAVKYTIPVMFRLQ